MTAKELAKILEANGWKLDRISASHHIYVKDGQPRPIPIPFHTNKDIGYLANRILKQAGLK
jgi:predicted RNA binding protein YcfA (HicA-like mRNA interferase family)